jgi:hypothetical protein
VFEWLDSDQWQGAGDGAECIQSNARDGPRNSSPPPASAALAGASQIRSAAIELIPINVRRGQDPYR